MATATTQDDDLLIIAEDSETDKGSNDIEFSFDFGEDTSKKEEAKTQEVSEIKADESVQESSIDTSAAIDIESTTTAGENDLGISFDSLEAKTEEAPVDEVKEETSQAKVEEDFSFDLGVTDEGAETGTIEAETTENVSEATQEVITGSDSSMNDILAATVAKLAARKDVIAADKAGKAQKEEDIKSQIKELEKQVKELEADMSVLDSESDKITTNISQLEKMKLDPVKEHNSKRVTKK